MGMGLERDLDSPLSELSTTWGVHFKSYTFTSSITFAAWQCWFEIPQAVLVQFDV